MVGDSHPIFRIRSFAPSDLAACRRLYAEGLLFGKLAENDTGADIDDIDSEYMHHRGSHLWVAENQDGQVVGMIGVQSDSPGNAEIRRLRVAQDHRRRGIGTALLETATAFCQANGVLKITLDTFMEREPAIQLFQNFRFVHERTRRAGEKEILVFYLDLYAGKSRPLHQDPGAAPAAHPGA